jgi:hypothetical protein
MIAQHVVWFVFSWKMRMEAHPESLLARLQMIPDPRRRQEHMYPLPALVGMLLPGVLQGRDSLRGAWVWEEQQWLLLWRTLRLLLTFVAIDERACNRTAPPPHPAIRTQVTRYDALI